MDRWIIGLMAEEDVEVGADGAVGGFDAPGFFKAKQEPVADFFLGGVGVGRLEFGDLFVRAEIVVFAEGKGLAIETSEGVENADVIERIGSGLGIGEGAVNVGQAELNECVLELVLLVEL